MKVFLIGFIIIFFGFALIAPIISRGRLDSKWKIVIYYFSIIALGTGMIKPLISTIKEFDQEEKILSTQNLIEYWDYYNKKREKDRWYEFSGLPEESAYAITEVNFREGPGSEYKVINVIPKGGKVNANRVLILDRKGDWFKVGYNGRYGYVNGKYLRPRTPNEKVKELPSLILVPYNYLFPEKSLFDKFIAFLLSIPVDVVISLLLAFIFGRHTEIRIFGKLLFDLDDLIYIIPMAYLMIRNGLPFNYSFTDLSIILMSIAGAGIIVGYPSSIIINKILDRYY